MPFHNSVYSRDRTPAEQWAFALGWITIAVASGAGLLFATRSLRKPHDSRDTYGSTGPGEQAVTIRAPLETVEAGWVDWCASGRIRLTSNYAVRFEPAPGARGTEVHLVGGAPAGTAREELRRFKQQMETGEIPLSDGPGLSRPAQPRQEPDTMTSPAEVW
jgi:hypothetical protein